MYHLLYDLIGLDAEVLDCPELYYNFVAGMSCILLCVFLYLILYFLLSVFRGTK